MDDQRTIIALYPPETEIDPLIRSLSDAGVDEEQIDIMTPLPLEERASARIGPLPLYAITIIAGLIGIGIGIFFAAGTALLYPLMTGGKPIVGKPIVAIVSYETMMLLAIVATFVTMIVAIKRSHRTTLPRDSRIDDGCIMLTVQVPSDSSLEIQIRGLLQQARPLDVYVRDSPAEPDLPEVRAGGRAAAAVLTATCFLAAVDGCSRDMQEQPSYHPLEAPRLHSPAASVPRSSRSVFSSSELTSAEEGSRLFHVNCSPCHGSQANGKGPVSIYLIEKPANLYRAEIQQLSEMDLYKIVTDGKDMMPPFKGELSAEERRAVVLYVKSLSQSKR
jgi:cytochrome c5